MWIEFVFTTRALTYFLKAWGVVQWDLDTPAQFLFLASGDDSALQEAGGEDFPWQSSS